MNTNYLYNVSSEDVSVQTFYYEKLRDSVSTISYKLQKSLETFDSVENYVNNSYSIDDVGPCNLGEIKNEILSRVNYLNYTVMPAIKQKINSLK